MHSGHAKVVLGKLGKFTTKYTNASLFASRQKEIKRLPEKDVFKVVILKYIITPEEILSSIQVFNSGLYDNIKDPCIDKLRKRSRPVIYTFNNEMKNIMLRHSSYILGVT